jgi:hypothetical protein
MIAALLLFAQAQTGAGFVIEPLYILGIGRWDCATAFRADKRAETSAWIEGFWTGRNAARQAPNGRRTQVGSHLIEKDVVAEVERACQLEPDMTMAAVLDKTFARLAEGL